MSFICMNTHFLPILVSFSLRFWFLYSFCPFGIFSLYLISYLVLLSDFVMVKTFDCIQLLITNYLKKDIPHFSYRISIKPFFEIYEYICDLEQTLVCVFKQLVYTFYLNIGSTRKSKNMCILIFTVSYQKHSDWMSFNIRIVCPPTEFFL